MATAKELKEEFDKLSDEEKTAFMRSVTHSFCRGFGKDPEKMSQTMSEMAPWCRDMCQKGGFGTKSFNMDMQGMMRMMNMMGATGANKA